MKNLNRDIEVYKLRKKFYESISKSNNLEYININEGIVNMEIINLSKINVLNREMKEFVGHMEKIEANLVNS